MAYATEADLDRVWGVQQVDLVTIDATLGGRDEVKISAALDDASAIVDSYCSRRYLLPLALSDAGTRIVTGYVCDIALARLATTAGRMSDIIKARSDQALAWLRDIAAARADLPVAAAACATSTPDISPNEAVLISDERVFTREKLRGW